MTTPPPPAPVGASPPVAKSPRTRSQRLVLYVDWCPMFSDDVSQETASNC